MMSHDAIGTVGAHQYIYFCREDDVKVVAGIPLAVEAFPSSNMTRSTYFSKQSMSAASSSADAGFSVTMLMALHHRQALGPPNFPREIGQDQGRQR
jgi:hypothetical protein